MTKELSVRRLSPIIRIPAVLFKGVDKRKDKIPITVTWTEDFCTVNVNKDKLKKVK